MAGVHETYTRLMAAMQTPNGTFRELGSFVRPNTKDRDLIGECGIARHFPIMDCMDLKAQVLRMEIPEHDKPAFDKLRAIALDSSKLKPSPFGDLMNGETVYDPSVRVAEELLLQPDPDKPEWNTSPNDPLRDTDVLAYAHTRFCCFADDNSEYDWSGREADLMSYKLNVYHEGGFFAEHVDTPSPEGCCATMLITVPGMKHTGGELVLRHKDAIPNDQNSGDTFVCDSAIESEDENVCHIFMFYSDIPHSVQKVISGARVTIAYKLRFSPNGKKRTPPRKSLDSKPRYQQIATWSMSTVRENWALFYKYEQQNLVEEKREEIPMPTDAMKRARANPEFSASQPKKSFGLLAAHKYTASQFKPQTLKGIDRSMYNALVEMHGDHVLCVPVIVEVSLTEYEERPLKVDHWRVYRCTEEDMRLVAENKSHEIPDEWEGLGQTDMKIYAMRQVSIGSGGGKFWNVIKNHQTSGGYTGNETDPSELDCKYVSGAFIVKGEDKEEEEEEDEPPTKKQN